MSKRVVGHLMVALPILLLAFAVTLLPAVSTAAGLVACEVLQSDDSVRIEITANGEWTHRSFRVEDPERFVLDLIGVEVGEVAQSTKADGRFVKMVRASQYRGGSDPVTRIVLDLVEGTHVNVETSTGGVALVAFGATETQPSWARGVDGGTAESVVWKSTPTEWPVEEAGADHWQGEGVGRIAS